MFAPATGAASEGEDVVNADAEVAEMANIAALAMSAATPPARLRVNMIASLSNPHRE
jgi:hypothetical protein